MYTSLFQIKLCMMYILEKYPRKDYGKNYKKPLKCVGKMFIIESRTKKIKRGNEDAGDDDGFPS